MQSNGQSIFIPLSKGKTLGLEIAWVALAVGALWLAYRSLEPDYWLTVHINIEGTTWLMRKLPVAARVGILGLIGLTLLWLAAVTMGRLLSDKPALIMDIDGIEGFPSGTARRTIRLRWDEIGDIKSSYGNLLIYTKRESVFQKRRLISVQTGETGMKDKDIVEAMQAFMIMSRLGPSASAAVQTAPLAPPATQPGKPVAPSPLVTRPSAVMASAAKPTFGTRRNFG